MFEVSIFDGSVASLLLVAMPFVTSSFLFLVVRPGATSSVLAPSRGRQECWIGSLDLGVEPDALESRRAREAKSLASFRPLNIAADRLF